MSRPIPTYSDGRPTYLRRTVRALRRVAVEIGAGLLYVLEGAWHWRWDLAWIIGCTAFATYWFTAWAFLIIDRMGY